MHPITSLFFLALLCVTGSWACEGDCIVGTVNNFIGNYTFGPVIDVVKKCHRDIAKDLPAEITATRIDGYYCFPFLERFPFSGLPDALQANIFPGFFHGKCLDENGNEPQGCPNPDCPVVCGTSGSMIHHYSELSDIVHRTVMEHAKNLVKPDSDASKKAETLISRDSRPSPHKRDLRIRGRPAPGLPRHTLVDREELIKTASAIFARLPGDLVEACGGPSHPKCQWEFTMKRELLRYP